VKRALDPMNLLNPGKVLPAPWTGTIGRFWRSPAATAGGGHTTAVARICRLG